MKRANPLTDKPDTVDKIARMSGLSVQDIGLF